MRFPRATRLLLGVIGSKAEAQALLARVQTFLQTLGLDTAPQKTGIRHAQDGVRFLGYDLRVHTASWTKKFKKQGVYTRQRVVREKLQLHIPQERLYAFVRKHGYGNLDTGDATHRGKLLQFDEVAIIHTYNAELRGFANYYSLALRAKTRLNKLYWVWWQSLFKTLAGKHNTSVRQMVRRMKSGKLYVWRFTAQNGKPRAFAVQRFADLRLRPAPSARVDDLPPFFWHFNTRTNLIQRLAANQCEFCAKSQGYVEVHHVHHMKDVKGKKAWEARMIALKRKTMVLCIECHDLLHAGKLADRRPRT